MSFRYDQGEGNACPQDTPAPITNLDTEGGENMAVHHGGKVGKAGKTLAAKGSSKSAKSKAGTTLANHKAKAH